jgi:uncharacterized membrane protein YhaH (DUF805 family)
LPEGRIPRRRYWLWYVLPAALIYLLAMIADSIIEGGVRGRDEDFHVPSPLGALAGLFFLWPSFAVTIKRLHDRGMTGWWALVANGFVPIAIMAVAAYWYWATRMKDVGGPLASASNEMIIATAVCTVLALLWLYSAIVVAFVRGQVGPNRYGEDPLPTPDDVRSDRTVTAVFAVITIAFVALPVATLYYYTPYVNTAGDLPQSAAEAPADGPAPAQ